MSAQHTPLEQVGALAIEERAARQKRAKARTHLGNLRRKWFEETGEFFTNSRDQNDAEGADELLEAERLRREANRELRLAAGRLTRAIAKATGGQA